MKKFASVLLILLGAIVFNAHSQADSTKAMQQDNTITLQIEGMACDFCARGLKNSLEKLDGLTIHEIDPEKGFAKLSFKPHKVPSDKILKDTVENAGLKLTKVERNDNRGSNDGTG